MALDYFSKELGGIYPKNEEIPIYHNGYIFYTDMSLERVKQDFELIAQFNSLPIAAQAVVRMEKMSQDPKRNPMRREMFKRVAYEWERDILDPSAKAQLAGFRAWEAGRVQREGIKLRAVPIGYIFNE